MTFKYEGKVYKLVPDDRSSRDVCGDCAFNDNADACASSYREGHEDCIDNFAHYEEVEDANV